MDPMGSGRTVLRNGVVLGKPTALGPFRVAAGNPAVSDGDEARQADVADWSSTDAQRTMQTTMAATETNHDAIPRPQFCGNRLMFLICNHIKCVATAFSWRAANHMLDVWTDCYLERPQKTMNSRA